MKKILLCAFIFIGMNSVSFAISSPAKEDTTPPAAEGPLTADQIQPIIKIGQPTQPPAPSNTPQQP